MQEIRVRSLGQEDPLEKGMAIHSSILTWRIPWTEEPGGLQSMRSQRIGHNRATNTNEYSYCFSKKFILFLFNMNKETNVFSSKATRKDVS